jgi:hypothetical protein
MNESTHITGPPAVPATWSGQTALKNVYGRGCGDSGRKDEDSSATNYGETYGYGDDSDSSDSEDDSRAYGYGGPGGVYGYGGNAKSWGNAYGYGYGDDDGDDDDDDDDDNKGGDDDDKGADYGYGEDKQDSGNPAGDYGYGDEAAAPPKPIISDAIQPVRPRTRVVRRNSCVILRTEQNPLAVAEYLLGGPPLMSDRDMDLEGDP